MCSIERNKLASEQCIELEDIMRSSIYDIVRVDEIDSLIEKRIFKKETEIMDMQEIANTVLPHFCNGGFFYLLQTK